MLPAQGTLGLRSPLPAHLHPSPLQQPPAASSAAPRGARSSGCRGGCSLAPWGWVRGPSATGAVHGPAAVFPVFCQPEAACVSGCFRAAPRQLAGPPHRLAAGSWGTHCSGFGPVRRRVSQELVSSRAAAGAGDLCGLASCNLAFTRLWGCKSLISASLICLKEPVYNNLINAT